MSKGTRTLLASAAVAAVALAAFCLLRRPPSGPGTTAAGAEDRGAQQGRAVEFIKVRLFFLGESPRTLRPVEREIEVPEFRSDLYRRLISLLLAGEDGLATPAPAGTELRSLHQLEGGLLLLDFNESLAAAFPGGTAAELEFVYFMVNNLCYNFPEIKKVKFLIGGNEVKSLAGHIDLERPFFPDFSWLEGE